MLSTCESEANNYIKPDKLQRPMTNGPSPLSDLKTKAWKFVHTQFSTILYIYIYNRLILTIYTIFMSQVHYVMKQAKQSSVT